ncbi:hypothetical protein ACPXCE_01860 [Streptomyces sp. DT24]|uniref:hypothetical protein n=1 Tax=Streptomyces sp. DT24 TaxID=3416520 RepID=UPI003CF9265D
MPGCPSARPARRKRPPARAGTAGRRRARPAAWAGPPCRRAGRYGHALAVLALVLLTLVGGAPTGAVPVRALMDAAASAAYEPGGHPPVQHTDRTLRVGNAPEPRRARAATSAAATDGDRPRVPSAPRAATAHAPAPHETPTTSTAALPPPTTGVLVPVTAPDRPTGGLVAVPDRFRAALPGVRGPPRATVRHRVRPSRPTDLPPRLRRTRARA